MNYRLKENVNNIVKEKICFDDEQRNVILDNSQNCLVIAGAGSGKTTVISAKVEYLVKTKNINPKEILVISFTNESVNDLKGKINNDLLLPISIKTFHKLGLEILKSNQKYKISDNLENILANYFLRDIYFTNNYVYYLEFYYMYICNCNLNKIKIEDNSKIVIGSLEEVAIFKLLKLADIKFKYRVVNFGNIISKFIFYFNNKKYVIVYSDRKKVFVNNNKNQHINLVKNTNILSKLINELKSIGILNFKSKKDDSLNFMFFLRLCCNFINSYKVNYCDFSYFDKLKNDYIKDSRISLFIRVIYEAYKFYDNYNSCNHIMDFNDIINKSICILKSKNCLSYKYVFVDEFQDISFNRLEIIRLLSKYGVKITAFGDDWQAIFGFAGSNVKLFIDFPKVVDNCKVLKISKTYRNSQDLIEIAGNFIMKNKYQIKKNLVSDKFLFYPIVIYFYDNENKSSLVFNIILEILKENKNSKILLIGRYNFDIKEIIDNNFFALKNNKIVCLKMDVDLTFLTAHSAKGMTYDDVIILNAYDGIYGFPSKVMDDYEISILKMPESYFFEEERRLFYVALTRTRNRNYIVVPIKNPSIFILELLKYENIKIINKTKYKLNNDYIICCNCGYFINKNSKKVYYCCNCKNKINVK